MHVSPEEKEQEYVKLFILGSRREDPILDVHLHEDGGDEAVGDEEPDDIGASCSPYSSPTGAPRAPPRMSRSCCEHINMLRQILQQMEKLTGKVNELNRKVDGQKNGGSVAHICMEILWTTIEK
ncbi:hypothetical protein Fot_14691 [Forsythia ovata]|uniref:Uncharacterized protein n=1 Tax=Forsythia ovata TaxID=205694 RepID=A0ABD1W717_9LAMI